MILSRLKVFTQTYKKNYGNAMNIKLEKAAEDDAEKIISIRNECFYDDYVQFGECPGYKVIDTKILTDKLALGIFEKKTFKQIYK